MKYEEFKRSLLSSLKEFYGDDATVALRSVSKNNGIKYDGIVISFNNDGIAGPVQYIRNLYESYEKGELSFDDCVGEIIDHREENKCTDEEAKTFLEIIKEWPKAKQYLFPVLVNTEKNRESLKELVHRDFLDLSIVYLLRFPRGSALKNCTMKITNLLLKEYGVTEEDLYKVAMENLEKDAYDLMDMKTVIRNILNDRGEDVSTMRLDALVPGEMYVYTNKEKMYGAAGILNLAFLKEQSKGRDFYIIPSSVHETIFIAVRTNNEIDRLNGIIKEVNDNDLDETEILSDHLYYYNGTTGEIRVAA